MWSAASRQNPLRPDGTGRSDRHPLLCEVPQHGRAFSDRAGILVVPQRAAGALPGHLGAAQVDAHAVGAQTDAVVLRHPVGEWGRRPGALPARHRGAVRADTLPPRGLLGRASNPPSKKAVIQGRAVCSCWPRWRAMRGTLEPASERRTISSRSRVLGARPFWRVRAQFVALLVR